MLFDILNLSDASSLCQALTAFMLCCALGLAFGGRAINWLQLRFREPIKSISPTVVRLHAHKSQTPTMGGIFLVVGVVLGTMICDNPTHARVGLAMLTVVGFAALGAIDDLVKLRTQRRGISAAAKLIGQFSLAAPLCWLLHSLTGHTDLLAIGGSMFLLVAAANAVNLTDGLDGLAGGCGLIASLAAVPLLIAADAADLSVVSAALAGSLAAFVYFNRHPARVFMGDTGSQAIGALLGYFAIAGRSPMTFAIVGGVFVAEAASVAIQLASYRLRGKRFFLCAPLHHHFQFAGWSETKIVRCFWLGSAVCAVIGLLVSPNFATIARREELSVTAGNLAARSRVQDVRVEIAETNSPSVAVVKSTESVLP